jgi:hypothetical protein
MRLMKVEMQFFALLFFCFGKKSKIAPKNEINPPYFVLINTGNFSYKRKPILSHFLINSFSFISLIINV